MTGDVPFCIKMMSSRYARCWSCGITKSFNISGFHCPVKEEVWIPFGLSREKRRSSDKVSYKITAYFYRMTFTGFQAFSWISIRICAAQIRQLWMLTFSLMQKWASSLHWMFRGQVTSTTIKWGTQMQKFYEHLSPPHTHTLPYSDWLLASMTTVSMFPTLEDGICFRRLPGRMPGCLAGFSFLYT